MFFLEFFYRKMRIEDEPEKVPVDDKEEMKSENKKFIWDAHESKKPNKNNMIEKENHEEKHCVVACDISQKTDGCIFFCFSPGGEFFCPTMFSLDFDFEHGEKNSEYEYVESKHWWKYARKSIFFKSIRYLFSDFSF